jgi:ABC-type uncharacterized transport system involved in gliding motility auxiliary subunit
MLNRILGFAGWLGTVLVFGAVAVRFVRPEWDQYAVWAVWAGLACVIAYTAGQWREILVFFKGRQARYGALASASVLVVLGILIAANYLSTRQNKRWDLTANRQFSLSEQTVKVLTELEAPVKFLVFDQGLNLDNYRPRITEYAYNSDQVEAEFVDVDKQPVKARQYAIDAYGTIILEYEGRQERATTGSEQDLTNALIKVVTGAQKTVYFVEGHGEKDQGGSDREGYGTVTAALGRDNYGVETLVLAQTTDVPDDASVVVIAGPKNDLLEPEVDMLRRYLNKGGHLLVLIDPPDDEFGPTPNLEGLLGEWSIELGNDIVVDASGMGRLLGTDASAPVAAEYPPHPITDRFRMLTAFPLARSVTASDGAAGGPRAARAIIETGAQSWAETDTAALESGGEVAMEPEKGDRPGPISIGTAVAAQAPDSEEPPAADDSETEPEPDTTDAPKPESRVVVVGDSDFAANYAVGIQGNRDLFLNIVSWLAQQENLIAIRPTEASDRRITMTAMQQTGVFWLSLLFIPAGVLGAGVYTWSRRR